MPDVRDSLLRPAATAVGGLRRGSGFLRRVRIGIGRGGSVGQFAV